MLHEDKNLGDHNEISSMVFCGFRCTGLGYVWDSVLGYIETLRNYLT